MGFKGAKAPSSTQPQAAKGLRPPASTYGDVIPIVCGEARVGIHLAWADFFKAIPQPAPGGGSKKGGQTASYQFNYTVSVILVLGEGALPLTLAAAPYNAARPAEVVTIGLARPGRQVISVQEATQSVGQTVYVDGGNTGPETLPPQPIRGTEPGCWRGKRVRHVGHLAAHGFQPMHFHEFEPGVFIPVPGFPFPPFYEGGQHDKMTTPGTRHYAPETYLGLATLSERDMALGSNASLPSLNFPFARLRYGDTDSTGFVRGAGGPQGICDAAADRILADWLCNWKHGAGWDDLLELLSGFDPALGDWSNFWYAENGVLAANSFGAYTRALGLLLSPVLTSQQSMAQTLDDFAILTDSAPLWSEGRLKMIPYGDAEAGPGDRTGITYTPANDPLLRTDGANVAVRWHLQLGDFLMGGEAKDDPVQVIEKPILPDQQTAAGYSNSVQVEFEERLQAYAKVVAEEKDEAAINQYGLVPRQPLSAPEIKSGELAHDVAKRFLARYGQKRNDYRFSLGWWHLLWEPMDVLSIPGEAINPKLLAGQRIAVRIQAIEESESGELKITAEEFPKGLAATPQTQLPTPGPDVGFPPGGGAGAGPTIIYPWELAVDLDGNVYIDDIQTDPTRVDNSKVFKYAPDGTFLAEWGAPEPGETFPEGGGGKYWISIGVDASGYVYSLQFNGPDGQVVHKYSRVGIPQLVWGTLGTAAGELQLSQALCVTPRGAAEVFVSNFPDLSAGADTLITVFTPDGVYLRDITVGAATAGFSFDSKKIATDGTYLYVNNNAELGGGHPDLPMIRKYDLTGTLITSWCPYGPGVAGKAGAIFQMAVDASGSFLYVADLGAYDVPGSPRVHKFTTSGTFVKSWHVLNPVGGMGAGSGGAGSGPAGGAGYGGLLLPLGIAVFGDRVYVGAVDFNFAFTFDVAGGPTGYVMIYTTEGTLLGQLAP